jgi:hypothetical protein
MLAMQQMPCCFSTYEHSKGMDAHACQTTHSNCTLQFKLGPVSYQLNNPQLQQMVVSGVVKPQ